MAGKVGRSGRPLKVVIAEPTIMTRCLGPGPEHKFRTRLKPNGMPACHICRRCSLALLNVSAIYARQAAIREIADAHRQALAGRHL